MGMPGCCRALGEFAAESAGEEASRGLVTTFFRAIEALDSTLAASARSGAPLDEAAARAALADTAAAIDKCAQGRAGGCSPPPPPPPIQGS